MKNRGFQKLAPMAAKRSLAGARTQGRPTPAPNMGIQQPGMMPKPNIGIQQPGMMPNPMMRR